LDGDIVPVQYGVVTAQRKGTKIVDEHGTGRLFSLPKHLQGRRVGLSDDGTQVVLKRSWLGRPAALDDGIYFVHEGGVIVCWCAERFYNNAAAQIITATPLLPPLPEPTAAAPTFPPVSKWRCPHVRKEDLKPGEVVITVG
jgi:hypothetical protein